MSFNNLKPQPPLYPIEAEQYASRALELSAAVGCERFADIRYGDLEAHTLDIYPVRDQTPPGSPVLIFAHGGAWTNGYKEWVGLMAPPLVAAGITLVCISYRLAPAFKWQAMLDDCLSAISWTHRHIREYGGDPERIALGGHSAGGHLTTLAAMSIDGLVRHGVPPATIKACFPLCAPLDIRYPNRLPDSGEQRTHDMLLNDSSEAEQASPVRLVDRQSPFTLLAYAEHDLPRVIAGNQTMAAELDRLDRPYETMVLPGDHFTPAINAGLRESPWTQRVIQVLCE